MELQSRPNESKNYIKTFKRRIPEHKKTYENLFEMIKRNSKKNFYSEKLIIKLQGDTKKTWRIMKELIGKSGDKSSFPQKIVTNKTKIVGETKIANE